MFPRSKRLPKEAFPEALKASRRLSSPHFTLVIPEETSGFAVVVSKKVARLSVTRHRIKRQVLSALRSLPTLPSSLVVFPRSTVSSVSYEDIQKELSELIKKLAIKK